MRTVAIIPARWESTRFPGKPLAMIGDKPMIQRVYEQVAQVKALKEIWVATDDERIMDAVAAFGGQAAMTSSNNKCGTDRCAELARELHLDERDIIINVQGDMPLIQPECITAILRCYELGSDDITTITCPLQKEDRNNPNRVKVYVTSGGFAKNFTREVIFHPGLQVFKHIGIYGYPMHILQDIIQLEETEQERGTHLEQLRWLHEYRINCTMVLTDVISVDTPEDLERVKQRLANG